MYLAISEKVERDAKKNSVSVEMFLSRSVPVKNADPLRLLNHPSKRYVISTRKFSECSLKAIEVNGMKIVNLKIDREDLLSGLGLVEAKIKLDKLLDEMMELSAKYPELIEFMKRIINAQLFLQSSVYKLEQLHTYVKHLEKELNIHQEPPEEYCSGCGRGDLSCRS